MEAGAGRADQPMPMRKRPFGRAGPAGLLPPSMRTRQTTQGDDPWVFEGGQTMVIQPNIITLDDRAGARPAPVGVYSIRSLRLILW